MKEKVYTMEDGNPLWGIVIILFLLFINAIVSCAKAALDTVNEYNVRKLAESKDKRAITLLSLLEAPINYINVFELLLSFSGILIGMMFYSRFLLNIEQFLAEKWPNLNLALASPVSFIIFTFLLVFFIALFGTIIPEKLGIKYGETIAYKVVGIMQFFIILLKPMNWLLGKTMKLVLGIIGINLNDLEENVTEEEIISMVNEGQEKGVFNAGEAEMISNIIEMGEKEADDIMTHKKKIIAISAEMSIEEALHLMLAEKYSRYPLYEDNLDNIIGIIYLKDVIKSYISNEHKDKTLKEIAREAYFVPDTININTLLKDMKAKNVHVAISIDEYGQTAGLVTMEDILEEIVGNIQDEYDEEENLIISKDEEGFIVKGSITLEDLEEELDITIDHEDFDTLNGLLIYLLDRIPEDGEKAELEYQGYRFNILETKNKMISQVSISKLPEIEANELEDERNLAIH
ncbi:MAG: HlyC/CorC family transporter [Clostridiales bacterium]|nr:HlyC/CorC family transporter [Clostridiales bacterium]